MNRKLFPHVSGRKSSSSSLEQLIRKRQHEEFRKTPTMSSLPEADISANSGLPPLPPSARAHSQSRQLSRTDSKKSVSSNNTEQSTKLAEMLGISTVPIPEETSENVAEMASDDVMKAVEKQIPFTFGSVPSTPEIYKAAENAVTDALRNVIGPHYEPKSSELQVNERLQTTTKASPTGSREDLPIVLAGQQEPSTSNQQHRPSSGTSNKSRVTLPTPTIEPTQAEVSANLDAVAEVLSQLPPIHVPTLPKLTEKNTSNTSPSTGRKERRPMSPKTARSLTSEKSLKMPTDPKKTISSSLKEKPRIDKKKSIKKKAEEQTQFHPLASSTTPPPVRKPRLKQTPIQAPITPKIGKPTKTPEVPKNATSMKRRKSTTSLKPKRLSSTSPTRQLSNISERSEAIHPSSSEPDINKLPSLSSRERSNPKLKRVDSKGSKLPQLVDPKAKSSKIFCNCDGTEYMLADIDIDLPGPYMIPASSVEDLKTIGISRLPRINTTTQSAPSTQRSINKKMPRQFSTKSEDLDRKLPPIDVDIDDPFDYDVDLRDSEENQRTSRSSTIAKKIASRKAVKSIYKRQFTQTDIDDDEDYDADGLVYEYKRNSKKPKRINLDHNVHEGCLKDQPPWDPTPLRDGELEMIPLDWNISRSNSNMSLGERRTQSQSDLRKITSYSVYSKPEIPKKVSQMEKSSSLTNVFKFKATIPDMDTNIINDIRKSLKKNNNWLDYD